MPRKNLFTKEEIVTYAYNILNDEGAEAIVARHLASKMGTTVAPIFSYFSSMDELKGEIYKRVYDEFITELKECINFKPSFQKFGRTIIEFCARKPNQFKFLFYKEGSRKIDFFINECPDLYESIIKEIINDFSISEEDANNLFKTMNIFSGGLCNILLNDPTSITPEFIAKMESEVCIGIVNNMKLRNGTFNINMAMAMANSVIKK